ncbi:uncharacterized protein LOC124596446 [Schistocerca americana]|uniref:uncharacterized protein LOC124596446 n=1 Tax=Schistocerca americana TaxID=7009 RepID=UPI001F500E11|nr:uncharacterized protein LOC124596446 [Schistocerca americana]
MVAYIEPKIVSYAAQKDQLQLALHNTVEMEKRRTKMLTWFTAFLLVVASLPQEACSQLMMDMLMPMPMAMPVPMPPPYGMGYNPLLLPEIGMGAYPGMLPGMAYPTLGLDLWRKKKR